MCILFKPRRERELLIVGAMIRMYCNGLHDAKDSLCHECIELREYARIRLEKCKFGNRKPVCKDCPVHCYNAHHRENMRKVMRWSGPKMISRHPVYAAIHFLDTLTAKKHFE